MDDNHSTLADARRRIQAAYDPELLQAAGHRLADLLGDHLRQVQGEQSVVLNWSDPRALIALAQETVPSATAQHSLDHPDQKASPGDLAARFADLVRLALSHGNNLHDPRYVGHQVPAPVPIAGLFDAVGSVTNQPMAIYEMGPWGTAVERTMIGRLMECLGWNEAQSAGIVTHGASLANLTALLVARNVALGESWERGISDLVAPDRKAPKLVVHADSHYCIARSAGILGLGTNHVVKAELDSRRRMDPEQLDRTLTDLQNKGHPIVAVVACACATPIGAFDPLEQIADVCERHQVWLHVDAAHGGGVLLSARHRQLVAGLERADSLTWDAHKMLFVPALCAFLFYKEKRHADEAFRQQAPYLFDPSAPGLAEYDSGLRTLECTKRSAALGLWGVWSLFGPQLFADMVDVTFGLGRRLFEKLRDAEDFVPLHEPECNIVMFRHVPEALRDASDAQIGDFQWRIRRAVIESGEYYLVPAAWNGVATLRCTLINPLTTEAHLDGLLEALRRAGREVLAATGAATPAPPLR
ncbi:MAG: pyridoxal phosphate-dependent decarboxylase family protein [Planctomycetales bacterium]